MPGTADNEVAPHKRTVIFNPRWAVIIGILAIGFLYLALPESLTFGPSWLLLAIEVVLLIPLIFVGITRRPMRTRSVGRTGSTRSKAVFKLG